MDELVLRRRRWWALTVMCGSLLVISLDNTILNVAIPVLIRQLHASTSELQWIVDGYTLVFAGLLLTAGSLGDRFGRRGALSTGLAIFCAGSAGSAFAGSASMLIFTRAFMGIGAALIMPATLSLLTNVFHDPRERARAIGVWAAVAGGGSAIGPVIGGFLLKQFWWGSVFLVNVPVTLLALVAGRFLLPASRDPAAPRIDLVGALLSIAGFVALLWAIIEAPTKGWSNTTVLVGLGAGLGGLAAFVLWELRCDHPMLDVRFFRNRRFSAANASITMVYFAMLGSMFVITQYLQNVLGYAPLEAGVRMLPMAVVMLLLAPTAPRLVERIGTKVVVGGGLLVVVAGLTIASTISTSSGYLHLVGAMVVISVGMALVLAPATESIMGSLPRSKAGVGSAMNDTTRQMGGALGVAVIGSIVASSYRPGVASGISALHLSPGVVASAKDSVGGAVDAAKSLPSGAAHALTTLAHAQFVDAFTGALQIAAVVVLLAAGVAFAFLPARAGDAREPVEGPLDGLASLTFAEAEGLLEVDAAAGRAP